MTIWAAFGQSGPGATPGMGLTTLIGVGNLEPMGPLDPHLIELNVTVPVHAIGLGSTDAVVVRSNATAIDTIDGTAMLMIADADVASAGEINASGHYNASDAECPEDDYILGINLAGITPVASFTETPTSGPGPLEVTFTDTSTNTPTSWLWEKSDDGVTWVPFDGTPTDQNPVEDFAVGDWSVRLTATNPNGSNTHTEDDLITAFVPGTPHQYWKLHDPVIVGASDPPPPADLELSEIRLFEYGTDVTATYGPTSTPSISNPSAGTFPTNLYDNNLSTVVEWTLAPGGTWFTQMLFSTSPGNEKYISGIKLGAGTQPSKWMTGFCWSYSDDGVAWTLVGCVQDIAYPGDNSFTPLLDTFTIPPTASFTGTPLSGASPLGVTFTDTSSGSPSSWLWEKNDGIGGGWVPFAGTPTAQNPVETFAAGTWDVRLTATNAGGNDIVTVSNYVTAAVAPVAAFTGTPLSGGAPLAVTFTDASTNTPTSWLWEKNSGSGWVNFAGTPTAQNPVENLALGTWSIRLTATNVAGSDTHTETNYVVSSIVGTTWNPADKTTNVTLAESNYLCAANNSTYEAVRTVRNNLNFNSGSGKVYFEAEVVAGAGGDLLIGIIKTSDPIISGTQPLGGSNVYACWRNSGTFSVAPGVGITHNPIALPYIVGSRLGFAFDFTNNKMWVSHNGIYPILGDPATGANPVISTLPAGLFAVVFTTDNNAGNDSIRLKTSTADLLYSAPTGFTAGLAP